VDCAGANRIPLALTPGFFDAEQACAGGACGLDDCCAPLHCHDAPGWTVPGDGYPGDCDAMARIPGIFNGYCAITESHYYCSADGACPAAACCACGGGSAELLPSCANPTGASWDEPAIDCATKARIALTAPADPGECAGVSCVLDDCCRPADWAPVCTGADVKALVAKDNDSIDPACMPCIGAHMQDDPAFCFPLPSHTACSAADTALDLHDKSNFALMSDACFACFITLDPDHNNPDDNPDFWGPCTGTPPSPTRPAAAKGSSSSGVIIAIVVIVLLLALGGGGGAFLMLQQP
jgi:hypothetical protein